MTSSLGTAAFPTDTADVARQPLQAKHCALLVVDIQEKLLPPIFNKDELVQNSQLLVRAAKILELPVVRRLPGWMIDWPILAPMRCATGGTILACRLAIEQGLAINLGGGYHHAASAWGGGFCVYADAAIAAKLANRSKGVVGHSGWPRQF